MPGVSLLCPVDHAQPAFARMPGSVGSALQDAPGWEADAPGPLAFAALLRACGPDTLQALLPGALQILNDCTSPDRCMP